MFSGRRKDCIGEEWVKKWTKLGLKIRNTKSMKTLAVNGLNKILKGYSKF